MSEAKKSKKAGRSWGKCEAYKNASRRERNKLSSLISHLKRCCTKGKGIDPNALTTAESLLGWASTGQREFIRRLRKDCDENLPTDVMHRKAVRAARRASLRASRMAPSNAPETTTEETATVATI